MPFTWTILTARYLRLIQENDFYGLMLFMSFFADALCIAALGAYYFK